MVLKVNSIPFWVFLSPLLAVAVCFTIVSYDFSIHDFTNYYFGSKLWVQGDFSSSSYLPCTFNEQLKQFDFTSYFGNYAPNVPFLLLFFAPFTALTPVTSKLLFNVIGVAVFLISFYRLCKTFNINKTRVLLLSVALIVPIKNNLLFGQLYLILSACIMEFTISYVRQKRWSATFFLAVATALKVFPAILLLIFLIRRDLKSIFRYSIWIALLALFSVSFIGIDITVFYLLKVLPLSMQGRLSEEFVLNYQSIQMWSKSLFIALPNYYTSPLYNLGPTVAIIFNTLLAGALIFIGLGCTEKRNIARSVSIWLVVGLLITPYGSTYSLILLCIAVVVGFKDHSLNRFLIGLLLTVLASVIHYDWFEQLPIYLQFPKLFLLTSIFVVLVFKTPFVLNQKVFYGVCLFMSLKIGFSIESDVKKEYAVSPNSLICKYRVEGNKILLNGLNRNGDIEWIEPLGPCNNFEKNDINRGLGYYTLYCKY